MQLTSFSHLLGQMYLLSDIDMIVLAGDLNSRIGKMSDTIIDMDNIPSKNVCIMRQFIGVYTVCEDKNDLQRKTYNMFGNHSLPHFNICNESS